MKYYLQKIGKSYYKCWYTKKDNKYIKHRKTLGCISKLMSANSCFRTLRFIVIMKKL